MDRFWFYLLNIFFKSALILFELVPYLIIGTIIGEALRYFSLHRLVNKISSKGTFVSTLFAAILGIVSPLCTFGTVPVVMGLNSAGMPLSVLIVFLISSSMMNPQLFIMTWGGIGAGMALMRVLTIMIFSLLMGWILSVLPEKWILNKKSLEEMKENLYQSSCTKKIFTWKSFIVNIIKSIEHVGFYVIIGVILAAAIEVLVPASVANKLFQQEKIFQILLIAVLSIPFYSCGGGVIPIVRSLISGGMSNGSALAFLNVGSATRITVIMALAAFLRPVFIFIYVLMLVAFSVVIGYLWT